jgi:putative tryptophan/tyrosine transport system substrate-binding protein
MRRRDFITLLGGAAAAWPLAARAQQLRRVGALINSTVDDPIYQSRVAGFRRSLRSLGWIEGKNLQLGANWTSKPRNAALWNLPRSRPT